MKGKAKRICAGFLGGVFLLAGTNAIAGENLFKNGNFEGYDGALTADGKIAGWYYAVSGDLGVENEGTENENHYFVNKVAADTDGKGYPAFEFGYRDFREGYTIDKSKVYRLSWDFRPVATVSALRARWNVGSSREDYNVSFEMATPVGEWSTFNYYVQGLDFLSNSSIIGSNGSVHISGEWCIDNVRFEELENEVVFADYILSQSAWAQAWRYETSSRSDGTKIKRKCEVLNAISSLAEAKTDAETGERLVDAQVHYLTEPTDNPVYQAIAAVYKEENGVKMLCSVDFPEPAFTATAQNIPYTSYKLNYDPEDVYAPMVSFPMANIRVPAPEENAVYSLHLMVWDSVRGMQGLAHGWITD